MKDLGGWGDLARRPSSLGDMTVECVGETRRLLLQAQQANRPTCGQKGLWLSAVRLCFVWSVKSSSKVAQTCNPVDYSPPGTSVHGDSPGKIFGVGCHALLQGIFPTQGLN